MDDKIAVYICYAHKDEPLMRRLEQHLRALEQQGLITIWHDRMIAGGADRKQEMEKHLDSARIVLLLVSANFLSSEDNAIEIKRAMERYHAGEARVIPIILRPVMWQGTAFGQLTPLPKNGKPITSKAWHSLDEAFIDVVAGVQRVVEELKKSGGLDPVLRTRHTISVPGMSEKNGLHTLS